MRVRLPILACLLTALALPAQTGAMKAVQAGLEPLYPALDALYLDLHRHPELSLKETRTAVIMADGLRKAGYQVTTGVGGTGVVGVLRNGPGPTLLLRTELDALPVEERTGLAYASQEPGVMHACGHDIHMTAWTGTATLLARMKDRWHGTLIMLGQPAEEVVAGARAMLADDLLKRFPRPDFAVAVHDSGAAPAGTVSWVEGFNYANVDSVDLTLYGKGGHGSKPESTVDPIVLAARTVMALQTIISREKDPLEPGVISVGSIHGGAKHNIIPDEVKLQLTVRSYSPAIRKQLLAAIARVAKAESAAVGSPREPKIVFSEAQDANYNDPALTRRLVAALERDMGRERVRKGAPIMGAEDFGEFGKAAGCPSVMLNIGAVEPETFRAAQAAGTILPSPHSSLFAPDRERTIRTGVEVLTLSALAILGKN